jgi:hypothetical protein
MTALVSIVVEMAGLIALLSRLKCCSGFLFGFGFILVPYQNFKNIGTSLAARSDINTRIEACLKPEAMDSSLILPATIPIR